MSSNPDNSVQQIPLANIARDPDQPRKIFDAKSLAAMATDIKARGVIQPITLRPNPDQAGRYIIVFGERRYRASKKAKLETIPAIITQADRDPLDRYIDQAAENIQRDGFKPMEMAQFFEDLHQKHGLKITDIPATLKARGLRVLERSYITNMRRLLDLPAWAKDWINDDRISPSHGKYILAARELEPVLDEIKGELEEWISDDIDGDSRPPNLADLNTIIGTAFETAGHADLYHQHNHRNGFDPESECKGCKNYRRIAGYARYQADRWFCLVEDCRNEKTSAHQAALDEQRQADQAAQRKANAKANAEREKAARESDQPTNQPAATDHGTGNPVDDAIAAAMQTSDTTTNEPPPPPEADLPEMTEAQAARAAGRIERTEQHLDAWLRDQLVEHLADDEATRYKLILWIAAGAPGLTDKLGYHRYDCIGRADYDYSDYDNRQRKRDFESNGINITLQSLIDPADLEASIATTAIGNLDRANLRRLAHHVGIELEGRYTINRDYLEIKTRLELLETTPTAVRECFGNWSKQTSGAKAGELVDWLLEWPQQYGVPADLAAMYAAHAPAAADTQEREAAK